MRMLRASRTLFVLVALVACRDAAEPFRPIDREPVVGAALRLTYSPADDRAPVWAPGGDSVYFTTSSWEENPLAPRSVLSLAADGMGSLTTVLRNVQEGTARANWISAPALTGDGERVAFVRVPPLLPDMPCFGTRVCPMLSHLPMVRLTEMEVHVRALDATHGVRDDLILTLPLAGHSVAADSTAPGGGITVSDYHPFQYQFEAEGRLFFQPSWNPDGTELVVSDGLRLLRWTPGATAFDAIVGTDDGVSPAWSPTGEWIAYTRHERLSSQTFRCEYQNVYLPNPVPVTDCVESRTIYETAPPQVVLVRPDGSEEMVLTEGVDPTWSPDGRSVYVANAAGLGSIARVSLDGAATVIVPDTEGGIEPAVSPDGTRLVYARAAGGSYDIWVVELP